MRSDDGNGKRFEKDKKSNSSKAYRAALYFLTKTWGRVQDIQELHDAILANIRIDEYVLLQSANGEWLLVEPGRTVASLPFKFQYQLLRQLGSTRYDVHFQGILHDVLYNELTDRLYAFQGSAIRNTVDSFEGVSTVDYRHQNPYGDDIQHNNVREIFDEYYTEIYKYFTQ